MNVCDDTRRDNIYERNKDRRRKGGQRTHSDAFHEKCSLATLWVQRTHTHCGRLVRWRMHCGSRPVLTRPPQRIQTSEQMWHSPPVQEPGKGRLKGKPMENPISFRTKRLELKPTKTTVKGTATACVLACQQRFDSQLLHFRSNSLMHLGKQCKMVPAPI